MATDFDFVLSGEQAAARVATLDALKAAGFDITVNPDGNAVARRGSMAKTLLFGAMAGKKGFQVTFPVSFYSDPQGNLIARLSRNVSGGVLKGGAIGASLTNNAFIEAGDQLGKALVGAGLLLSSFAHE